MKNLLHRIFIMLAIMLAGSQVNAQSGNASDEVVVRLQKEALSSDLAWNLLASLTSEVGPRMGGTQGDREAVKWADAEARISSNRPEPGCQPVFRFTPYSQRYAGQGQPGSSAPKPGCMGYHGLCVG